MAEKVASLYAEIGANVSGFQQGAGQVQAGLTGIKGQFQSMGAVGAGAMDSLGLGMLRFAGPAAIGAAVVGVGKLALGLSDMREQSEMVEARFRAQVGGAGAATEAYDEMNRALGDALDRDEKMIAAGQIMGLGLADNAKDVAELAKQAAYLGDKTQSVSSRIESLTQVLVTGRTMGLREFGISTAEVNQRVDELKVSQSGLSDIEAKQVAIKEALTGRLADYIAEGGKAATETQKLESAWRTLKDTAADRVNLEAVVTILTTVVKGATLAIGPEKEQQQQQYFDTRQAEEYQQALENLTHAQEELTKAQEAPMLNEGQVAAAQAEVDLKQAIVDEMAYLRNLKAEWNDVGTAGAGAMRGIAAGAKEAGDALGDVTFATPVPKSYAEQIELTSKALEGWKQHLEDLRTSQAVGVDVDASQVTEAERAVKTLGDELVKLQGMSPIEIKAQADVGIAYTPQGPTAETDFWTFQQEARIAEANRNSQKDAANEAARIQRRAADDFQRRVEDAGREFANNVENALDTTKSNIANLTPEIQPGEPNYELSRLLKEGPLASGANGPTENLYRLLEAAFAPGGGKWGPELGVTPEYAQGVMRMVGTGDMENPEVQKWIDQKRLEEIAGGPEGAKAALQAQSAQMGLTGAQQVGAGQAGLGADIAGQQMTSLVGALDALNKILIDPQLTGSRMTIGEISVMVAPGAVVVSGGDATGMGELVGQTIAGALKELSKAEQRVNIPPPRTVPGAQRGR
jgi:hypothetical protein